MKMFYKIALGKRIRDFFLDFLKSIYGIKQSIYTWHFAMTKFLSLYNTIPTFNDLETECFWKHCGKRRKCWGTSILSFSQNVFSHTKGGNHYWSNIKFCCMEMLLVYSRQKSCCLVKEELTHYHTMPHFDALKIYSCGKHCEKRRNCLKNKFKHCILSHIWIVFC